MTVSVPALPNDDSFFNRFFIHVGGYRDTAGRPLHEVDFRAEENPESFKTCPFQDSRTGTLINHTALRQIMQDWSVIERGLGFFSSFFPIDTEQQADLFRAWRISLMTMFAPVYLMHRKEQRLSNGQIPTYVSGLFKIMLDVPTTFDLVFLSNPLLAKTMHGQEAALYLYKFANDTAILVNGRYACAGSPKLIENIGNILVKNPQKYSPDTTWSTLFPRPEHFQRFFELMSLQYIISVFYQSSLAAVMERRCEKLAHKETDPLSAYERRRRFVLSAWEHEEVREASLKQFLPMTKANTTEAELLECAIESTLCFLNTSSSTDLIDAHDIFHSKVVDVIGTLQKMIQEHLGVDNLFEDDVRFTRKAEDHPISILNHACLAGRKA